MVKRLKEEGHSADAIHGDLRQSKRDRVINSFRKGLKRILIATDVAARGLDIPLIQHVINFDLPQVPEDYVHRIGRTARAGTEGSALTFLTPDDRSMWNEISKLIDPNFKPAPRGARGNSRNGRKGKAPYNKKRKFRDEKKSFSKGRSERPSRDGEKKSFGYKGKSSFGDKSKSFSKGRSERPSRDGEKKALAIKENLVLEINQNLLVKEDLKDPSRDGEKKSFGYKGKSSFTKKNNSKPTGFTNNPKYFGKKTSESSSTSAEKKSSSFDGKKKFKSRSDRPKSFTFKKHSQKRTKV